MVRKRALHEVVFDFFEQALLRRAVVDRQRLPQLFEDFALLARQLGRDLDVDVNVKITASVGIEDRCAAMPQLELRAVLSTFGNL